MQIQILQINLNHIAQQKKYKKLVKLALKNKIKYKRNLKNFDYEEINKTSLEKWRKIFNS